MQPQTPPPPSIQLRLGLVLLVLLALAAAAYLGAFDLVAEPQALAAALLAWGAWGYLAFVLSYALLQPFGLPGTVFVVAAPLIWPWQTAFVLSMAGTMGASVLGFSFARFVARDWVSARIPERFRRYERSLARNGLLTVMVLRLIFWMPQVLHFSLGVSPVSSWAHFWGSLLGYIPPLLAISYFGGELFDGTGALQPGAWRILVGMTTTSLLISALARYASRRMGLGAEA
jgi:uncharacterized membrane protein YdjX (TVP38/TMEM64 family)